MKIDHIPILSIGLELASNGEYEYGLSGIRVKLPPEQDTKYRQSKKDN